MALKVNKVAEFPIFACLDGGTRANFIVGRESNALRRMLTGMLDPPETALT